MLFALAAFFTYMTRGNSFWLWGILAAVSWLAVIIGWEQFPVVDPTSTVRIVVRVVLGLAMVAAPAYQFWAKDRKTRGDD